MRIAVYILLHALPVLFACTKPAPAVPRSPGKTRAPVEIVLQNARQVSDAWLLTIAVKPHEPLARGSFYLRSAPNNPQNVYDRAAGAEFLLYFSFPKASTGQNPVLDAETTIGGMSYRTSHEIILAQREPATQPMQDHVGERNIEELR